MPSTVAEGPNEEPEARLPASEGVSTSTQESASVAARSPLEVVKIVLWWLTGGVVVGVARWYPS